MPNRLVTSSLCLSRFVLTHGARHFIDTLKVFSSHFTSFTFVVMVFDTWDGEVCFWLCVV